MFPFQRSKKKEQKLWSCCLKRLQEFKQLQHQQLQQTISGHRTGHILPESSIDYYQQDTDSAFLSTQYVCMSSNYEKSGYDSVSYPMETDTGSSAAEEMSIEQDCCDTKTDGYYYENCTVKSIDDNYDTLHEHPSYCNCSKSIEKASMLSKELLITEQCPNLTFRQLYPANSNSLKTKNTGMSTESALENGLYATVNPVLSDLNVANYYPNQHQQELSPKCPFYNNNNNNTTTNSMMEQVQQAQSTISSSLSATATNMFRRCCPGRSSLSNESSMGSTLTDDNIIQQHIQNHNNNNRSSNRKTNKSGYDFFDRSVDESSVKELFLAFTKKLKVRQMSALCNIIEKPEGTHQSPDCILVPRESIGGEEPNVVVCRLLLWPDLRMASELKRIPTCRSSGDKVYVCCNPNHWNRILVKETPPPPYQHPEMDRLRPEDHSPSENSKDGGVSPLSGNTTGLRVQSFSTSGEERSSQSFGWCQIAYWELAKRVGDRFKAKNSIITICWKGSDGMCLSNLAGERNVESVLPNVEKTRNQIGLGIILSQEADGVWLYNRSAVAIFVHSPTLNDDCGQVSKVPPGRCLNAFDENRARMQEQRYLAAGAQEGPIDTFSMQISFVKGWSGKYKRPNITKCPCWLEVLFSRR